MPHRLVFTCRRTGAVVVRDYSGPELALLYLAADRAELADGGTLHSRWTGMYPEHITVHDASVPRRIGALPENPHLIEAQP